MALNFSLAVRGSDGLLWYNLSPPPSTSDDPAAPFVVTQSTCFSQPIPSSVPNAQPRHSVRCMQFSEDGAVFAYCDGHATHIVRTSDRAVVHRLSPTRTQFLCFSPDNQVLATWEPYVVYGGVNAEGKLPEPNMRMWSVMSGEMLLQTIVKRQPEWQPQWAGELCCRVAGSEVLFASEHIKPLSKFVAKNVRSVSLSPGRAPHHIAVYIPVIKGQPASLRLHVVDHDNFAPVSNKTFMNADSVTFAWSPNGQAILCTASTDVDKSNQSYYGEQQLFLMLTTGESYRVQLEKKGPIYAIDWTPRGNQFCVVYGYMPARATVFDLRASIVHDMGEGARNNCQYNQSGDLLLLSGFGNLAGNMEFWHPDAKRLVCRMKVANTTQCLWAPGGQHVVTATTSPRLRIDNGWRVWHYTGSCVAERMNPTAADELWEVMWLPRASTATFTPVFLSKTQRENAGLDARGKAAIGNAAGLGEDNSHPADALVNTKGAYVPPHLRNTPGGVKKPTELGPKIERSSAEKRLRGLQKKVNDIEKLKVKLERGDKLEVNQLTKIESYAALLLELQQCRLEAE